MITIEQGHVINTARRVAVTAFIQASAAELTARNLFKTDNTPEHLAAWVTAKNTLEDRKRSL